jgi:hypothetical protein
LHASWARTRGGRERDASRYLAAVTAQEQAATHSAS